METSGCQIVVSIIFLVSFKTLKAFSEDFQNEILGKIHEGTASCKIKLSLNQ